MSLMRLKSRDLNIGCVVHNKSSFSQRICDDLSEFILQYLPLEDKLRLESVSKQFQRTIFEKVYQIDLDDFINNFKYNLCALESVLKKCTKINSLVDRRMDTIFCANEVLDLIIKYCNNLNEINTYSSLLCKRLSEKFNSKSFSLKTWWITDKTVCHSLSHIKELQVYCNLRDVRHGINCFDGLKNLKRVSLHLYSVQEFQCLELFLQNNPKLKYLEIDFTSLRLDSNHYNKALNALLNHLSKLNQLIHLKLLTKIGLNEIQFQKGVNKIALNCKHLKSFGLIFNLLSNNCSKINEFLSSFKSLKRLNIEFTEENTYEMFSFELFQGLQYLTHLSLNLSGYPSIYSDVSLDIPLCDTILANISKYLPKLQYLEIGNRMEATHSLANILSALPKLQTIKLHLMNPSYIVSKELTPGYVDYPHIPYPHEENIRDLCKKVRLIKLNYLGFKAPRLTESDSSSSSESTDSDSSTSESDYSDFFGINDYLWSINEW